MSNLSVRTEAPQAESVRCEKCNGVGQLTNDRGYDYGKCGACNGTGLVPVASHVDALEAAHLAHFDTLRELAEAREQHTDSGAPVGWTWYEPASVWNGFQGREQIAFDKPKPTAAPNGCKPVFHAIAAQPQDAHPDPAAEAVLCEFQMVLDALGCADTGDALAKIHELQALSRAQGER